MLPSLPILELERSTLPGASRVGNLFVLQMLAEQQELTAVEEFAREWNGNGKPAQSRYYEKLLPATPPGPGQQYGFEVDLDRCSGCKACVAACHSLNGLDEFETWRDVGLLVGGTAAAPVMQHVTAACHHCLEPACASACPVNAYEKDPLTGIVKHLDDQCFGCQYCTLACPYDVPKYHPGKGIVRKCDMCATRLATGEAPACVQACPHEAIAIRVVDVRQVHDDAEADPFLPAAPEPHLTYPTTSYKTRRVFPRNLLPADYQSIAPQHPHWPLIVMLVLTQLSVGGFAGGFILEGYLDPALATALRPTLAVLSLVFGLLAIAASTFHLGRPQYAFRAVLGLRHSWLSREIVAFGAFAGLAVLYAVAIWTDIGLGSRWLAGAVTLSGVVGVFCSAMIYATTRREFWNLPRSGIKFLLTTVMLGLAVIWLALAIVAATDVRTSLKDVVDQLGPILCRALIVVSALKLAHDAYVFRHLATRRLTILKRSAKLMLGPLSKFTMARFAAGVLGGLMMPGLLLDMTGSTTTLFSQAVTIGLLFVACLMGELFERYLYFAACAAPRMPGGLRT